MMYGRKVAINLQSANLLTAMANDDNGRLMDRAVLAGAYTFEVGEDGTTGWHWHEFHQLEYVFEGVAEVETRTARYLLPPQQAMWIPAGLIHCSTLKCVRGISVFFAPAPGLPAGDRVRILGAPPLIREMLRYASRWPITRTKSDRKADAFFEVLAGLVVDWLDHEAPMCLPATRHAVVAAAIAYSDDHLADLAFDDVCRAAGTSGRTLRRIFAAETGTSWRRYVHESRLLRAMAHMAEGDCTVLGVALAVGFQSVSAFSRAFVSFTGETPTSYRQRIRSASITRNPDCDGDADRGNAVFPLWSHRLDSCQAPPGTESQGAIMPRDDKSYGRPPCGTSTRRDP
jgi:AraC-like DNA-binding protein